MAILLWILVDKHKRIDIRYVIDPKYIDLHRNLDKRKMPSNFIWQYIHIKRAYNQENI